MFWHAWWYFMYCWSKYLDEWFTIDEINVKKKKKFKAYYGFRVLYVFPFPSAGHWPLVSGRDKVGIRAWVFIADLKLSFCVFFLHYCGIRLSNIGFVIIASSILRCVYFVVMFDFVWFVFSKWGEHEILLLLKHLMMWSSPFRIKLLFLFLDVEEEIAMVEEYCFRLCLFMCDFRNGLVDLILWYFDC